VDVLLSCHYLLGNGSTTLAGIPLSGGQKGNVLPPFHEFFARFDISAEAFEHSVAKHEIKKQQQHLCSTRSMDQLGRKAIANLSSGKVIYHRLQLKRLPSM
jgi:hypothetical protein